MLSEYFTINIVDSAINKATVPWYENDDKISNIVEYNKFIFFLVSRYSIKNFVAKMQSNIESAKIPFSI